MVGLSVVGIGCSGGDKGSEVTSTRADGGTTTASVATIEAAASLPPIEVPASDVSAWLAGDGAALSEVRRIGHEVIAAQGAPTAEVCSGWVQELAGGPDPEQLVEVAGTSPDPVIGDALGATVIALNRVLSRCVIGESLDADSREQVES